MQNIFIDVREPEEFANGHVKNAINIPPLKLMTGDMSDLKDISKDSQLIVYCRSGSRSNMSINILKSLGYSNVINGINQQQVEAKYL